MIAIEFGVQVQILLEGFVIFFSFTRLVGNPTSDCKRNEGAKDAYKRHPLGGPMYHLIWWLGSKIGPQGGWVRCWLCHY